MGERGRFLSLEGVEGVGKTTNLAFIEHWLRQQGIDPLLTREPGGTPEAERIRALLLDPHNTLRAETEMLLMAASRVEHLETVIEPALEVGRWVLSDRYLDASLAYQGGGRELGVERVRDLHALLGVTRLPDLTLLLDLSPEQSRERVQVRSSPDRIEREDDGFFTRVRDSYLAIADAEPERVVRIDAGAPLEAVQENIAQALQRFLERIA